MSERTSLSALTDRALVEHSNLMRERWTAAKARHARAMQRYSEEENAALNAAADMSAFATSLEWIAMERERRDA